MKKLLSVLLILVMVFTFAACGNNGDSGEGGEGEGHPCVLRPELPQEPLEVRQGRQGSHDRAGQVR